jgi:hypothetical protein
MPDVSSHFQSHSRYILSSVQPTYHAAAAVGASIDGGDHAAVGVRRSSVRVPVVQLVLVHVHLQ